MADFVDEDVSSCSENWDSSDEDEVKAKQVAAAPAKKKKGKQLLAEKLAERERKEKEERERANMSPADRLALQKKKQEEDELVTATEFVDIKDPDSIDLTKFKPTTKYEFEQYAEAMSNKILSLQDTPFYTQFLCDITRESIKPVKLDEVRKVEKVLSAQINDLVKSSKGKQKKNNKKTSLNAGAGKGLGPDTNRYDDDYDDIEDMI